MKLWPLLLPKRHGINSASVAVELARRDRRPRREKHCCAHEHARARLDPTDTLTLMEMMTGRDCAPARHPREKRENVLSDDWHEAEEADGGDDPGAVERVVAACRR